jgi:hypothetical protein
MEKKRPKAFGEIFKMKDENQAINDNWPFIIDYESDDTWLISAYQIWVKKILCHWRESIMKRK